MSSFLRFRILDLRKRKLAANEHRKSASNRLSEVNAFCVANLLFSKCI